MAQTGNNTINGINALPNLSKKATSADTIKSKSAKNVIDTATVASDSLEKTKPKRDIETTIKYSAEDSIILDGENKTAYLYKDAKVVYGNKDITANTIDIDYSTNVVTAVYATDSTGKKIGTPVFKEGGSTYEAGQIKYNYKTKRGQVKQIVTKQGDGIVHGNIVKKEPNNTMYVEGALYTTCNLREPHFCIKAVALKVIPKKKIVTKAFNMQIGDVPTIIAFPFGLFPIPKRRGSGLIFPSYGESQTRGFFLTNGGFFWAFNDYLGLRLVGDVYTSGGGRASLTADYKSRYSYTGNMNLSYTNLISNPNDPTRYTDQNQYWVNWSHSTLTKGTGRFTASVNAGSTNYNRTTSYNNQLTQTASFTSNVSYSNVIKKTPFSYAISGRQTQNIATGLMEFTLPEASLNMNRIYPLKDIPFFGKAEPIKKFNFAYSSSFSNKVFNILSNVRPNFEAYKGSNTYLANQYRNPITADLVDSIDVANYYRPDTVGISRFFNDFGKNSRWTLNHNVPISTTVKVFRFFSLNPNARYSETWYQNQYGHHYDGNTKTIKVDTVRSFSSGNLARKSEYSGGVNVTTRIYGTFYVKKWNIEALRHTIVPTVGYTYTPNFTSNYTNRIDTNYIGKDGNEAKRDVYFDRFFNTKVTDPSRLKDRNNISFSISNTLEIKVRDVKDTVKVAYKKYSLLDNFSIASNYNLSADSFQLDNFALSARTKLFGIFDINFSTTFDPYYYSEQGPDPKTGHRLLRRTPLIFWNKGQKEKERLIPTVSERDKIKMDGLGRFTRMNLSVGTRFAPKGKGRKVSPVTDGTDYQFMARSYYPGYVDWSIPWSLGVSYIMTYDKYGSSSGYLLDRSTYKNNFSVNGDLSITTKFKVTFTTGYDMFNKQVTPTTLNFSRDLHCWYATLSWGVYPQNRQFFIATLGIKSGSLSDLKIPRRSAPALY